MFIPESDIHGRGLARFYRKAGLHAKWGWWSLQDDFCRVHVGGGTVFALRTEDGLGQGILRLQTWWKVKRRATSEQRLCVRAYDRLRYAKLELFANPLSSMLDPRYFLEFTETTVIGEGLSDEAIIELTYGLMDDVRATRELDEEGVLEENTSVWWNDHSRGSRIAWFTYLIAFLIILIMLNTWLIDRDAIQSRVVDLADVSLILTAVAALLLHIFDKKVLPSLLWKIFAIVFLGWELSMALVLMPAPTLGVRIGTLAMLVVMLPLIIGVLRYAFRWWWE